MEVTGDTRLRELMERYPWLLDEAVKIEPKFRLLNTLPGRLLVRRATITGLSEKSGLSVEEIVDNINRMIREHKQPGE